jgi:hypothetical protein
MVKSYQLSAFSYQLQDACSEGLWHMEELAPKYADRGTEDSG